MRHFWRWLCGYICICIKGRQVNRFLNLCSRNGIHLWRIYYHMNQEIHANIHFRDLYDLKPYLRKTKTKIRIISRKGFPFWCYRHPRLKFVLCIVICILCIGIYSTNYVWDIRINGNQKITTQAIIDYLGDSNIIAGLKKGSIDCSSIEIMLREHFQQIGWVSVYLENTHLCIEIKESLYDVLEDSEIEPGKQYDLIANKDAIIYSIVTRHGQAVVIKNQFVRKGQLLILGKNEIYDDAGNVKEILHFQADALIYGDVIYEYKLPLTELEILSLKIANVFCEETLLQLGYHKIDFLIDKLESNGVEILDKKVTIQQNEHNICFWVKLYARERIGVNKPVEEVFKHEFE